MRLSKFLYTAANVLGKASVYLRDAAALTSCDVETIGRRAINRFIADRNKNTYLKGRRKK